MYLAAWNSQGGCAFTNNLDQCKFDTPGPNNQYITQCGSPLDLGYPDLQPFWIGHWPMVLVLINHVPMLLVYFLSFFFLFLESLNLIEPPKDGKQPHESIRWLVSWIIATEFITHGKFDNTHNDNDEDDTYYGQRVME